MADPRQLEIAMQGVRAWNEWWNSPSGWRTLYCVDLSGADFSGLDLSGIDWNYITSNTPSNHFENCNFENCNFRVLATRMGRTCMNGGIFTNANFRGADLRNVAMAWSTWDGADLEGALFDESTHAGHADFSRALNVPATALLGVGAESAKFPPHIESDKQRVWRRAELMYIASDYGRIKDYLLS